MKVASPPFPFSFYSFFLVCLLARAKASLYVCSGNYTQYKNTIWSPYRFFLDENARFFFALIFVHLFVAARWRVRTGKKLYEWVSEPVYVRAGLMYERSRVWPSARVHDRASVPEWLNECESASVKVQNMLLPHACTCRNPRLSYFLLSRCFLVLHRSTSYCVHKDRCIPVVVYCPWNDDDLIFSVFQKKNSIHRKCSFMYQLVSGAIRNAT